jgi:hypothetical protein
MSASLYQLDKIASIFSFTTYGQAPSTPTSINFEDIVVSWYLDLILDYNQATNETGVDNQIFHTYGLIP